jgi:hypothetical protein
MDEYSRINLIHHAKNRFREHTSHLPTYVQIGSAQLQRLLDELPRTLGAPVDQWPISRIYGLEIRHHDDPQHLSVGRDVDTGKSK